ncbi:MAG: hypothetical protein WC373_12215 [Smithella sp.]|jgi:hypothetical protein
MSTVAQLQNEFLGIVNDVFFGEDIVYIASDVEYNLRAMVYRHGLRDNSTRFGRIKRAGMLNSEQSMYDFEIRISSDAVHGRESINVKSDSVRLFKTIGGQEITTRVMEITQQDPATYRLGLSV